ncbi:MAG: hypothetical protein CMK06_02610 [Ponticaulis sp.]|nr:hypothetical protein [Ponticaulis sp.]|tara:strand:+ start:5023 stop:5181 length:159 start_codon:yes stop_codon:yes gene_type:complete
MTGVVTGGQTFVLASFVISAAVLIGLAIWTIQKLSASKKKLAMLEKRSETSD